MARVAAERFPVGMSLFTLATVAMLVGLGVWQLQRRVEKHALIAALEERLNAAPSPLPSPSQWNALTAEHDEFRRVTFEASFRSWPDAKVYTTGSALRTDMTTLGAFVFAPAAVGDETVVVDRGFVPDRGQAADVPVAPVNLTGYIRFPEQPGWLTPAADVGKRLWFTRDTFGMAKALKWGGVAPFYIDLESPAPPSGLPKPAPLEVHLRDDHLQYAITWFGLALSIAIAFAVWLRGRLRPMAET